MNDPATEAAQRAWDATAEMTAGGYVVNPYRVAKTAAREMARPIRELVEKAEAFGDGLDMEDLKKLIYPPHELRSRTNA